MKSEIDYQKTNRNSWNNKVDIHLKSEFYDMEGFLNGNTSLKEIELKLLGDIKGKSVLHLQCHFGQDSISLARLGAQVVGVDLSDKAIAVATDLAEQTGADAKFICCDIYDLPRFLDGKFDIVFTSYGTVGWLPDLDKWADVVSAYLAPAGKFIFVDFHPIVWMLDEDFEEFKYSYFNSGPILEEVAGTYADRNAELDQEYVEWNHSLSEIINALITQGLRIELLNEYDFSPHNCFKHTIEFSPGKFRIKHLEDKIPLTVAIVAKTLV